MKSLLSLCFLLSCLSGFAQKEKKDHTCRILFLQRPREAPSELYLFDGATSRKVELPSMNFSPVYELQGGDLALALTPNPVIKAEELPQGVPTVRIPANMVDFYLLIVSDPENKTAPVRMLPVDANSEKLQFGETLWINLTTHTIAAKLGPQVLTIESNSRMIAKPPLAVSGYYKAEFLYRAKDETAFQPVMNKSWWFDANSKNLGFIINTGSRLPKIVSFRDHRYDEPVKQEN